jgi:hypothetical protein
MLAWDARLSRLSWIIAGLIALALAAVLFLARAGTLWIVTCLPAAIAVYVMLMRRHIRRTLLLRKPIPQEWREILGRHVPYYSRLQAPEKRRFEDGVRIFLNEQTISAVSTEIDDTIPVLVASAAVMLIFGRPEWEYPRLPEILIYPRTFDEDYGTRSHKRKRNLSGILVPQGAVVLAKKDLPDVAIHEFAHALDMGEPEMRGVPADLHPSQIPRWEKLLKEELARVRRRDSVLDPYAGTDRAELFAVAVKHFFLEPDELRTRHEALYRALSAFFNQDPAGRKPE